MGFFDFLRTKKVSPIRPDDKRLQIRVNTDIGAQDVVIQDIFRDIFGAKMSRKNLKSLNEVVRSINESILYESKRGIDEWVKDHRDGIVDEFSFGTFATGISKHIEELKTPEQMIVLETFRRSGWAVFTNFGGVTLIHMDLDADKIAEVTHRICGLKEDDKKEKVIKPGLYDNREYQKALLDVLRKGKNK